MWKFWATAGSEVAQLGLKYVHNDTCYPALLVIGQFIDALNSGKYDLDHTALLITQTGAAAAVHPTTSNCCAKRWSRPVRTYPVASLNFSGLEKAVACR